jgi:hypothetical protein
LIIYNHGCCMGDECVTVATDINKPNWTSAVVLRCVNCTRKIYSRTLNCFPKILRFPNLHYRVFFLKMFFTALMNIIILLLNEYFLFKNHWNTVLMIIINLLLSEHVMVSPTDNVLIIVLVFYYCLIRVGLFYSGSQCSHYLCRSLTVYIYFV